MGGSSKGGSKVEAPDPMQMIELQKQFNRPNVVGPYGKSVWQGNNLVTKLSPQEQAIMQNRQGIQQQMGQVGQQLAGQLGGQAVTAEGLPEIQAGVAMDDLQRQRVEDALYGRAAGRLDQRFGNQQRELEQQLANRGIPIGSEAYSRSMGDLNTARNDAFADATARAIAAGGQEQSRMFGLESQNAAMQNAARSQGLQERLGLRGQQFNELAQILGASQERAPQQAPITPIDVMGPFSQQLQMQMANQQQQQANKGGMFGTIGSIAGAVPMFL